MTISYAEIDFSFINYLNNFILWPTNVIKTTELLFFFFILGLFYIKKNNLILIILIVHVTCWYNGK